MSSYELLLKGARVVDPFNKLDNCVDIGISKGMIKCVKGGINPRSADKVIDLDGKTIIPGIIDPHVHIGKVGCWMMAKAGVVTAVDFDARMNKICETLRKRGSGMNIATLTNVRAYGTAPSTELGRNNIEKIIERAINDGALGVKITGGHRPFTPDTTRRIIEVANEKRAYVAFHVGTTATGSNLEGLKEAIELAGENRLHVAHVNSYLRGLIKDPVKETLEGLAALKGKKNLVSESYLAIINGTRGKCSDGTPESHVTRNCLRLRNYPSTQKGLERAIMDGFALVNIEMGREVVLVTKEKGLRYWKEAKTDIRLSFPVNVPACTYLCATAKDEKGEFIIDAISTDGGDTPRNVAVKSGLALVEYGSLALEELVRKLSLNPARMFGMTTKGHLGVGADADITVLDFERREAIMGIARGKVIMVHGLIVGNGGTILTTKKGINKVKATGLRHQLINLEESKFYH